MIVDVVVIVVDELAVNRMRVVWEVGRSARWLKRKLRWLMWMRIHPDSSWVACCLKIPRSAGRPGKGRVLIRVIGKASETTE